LEGGLFADDNGLWKIPKAIADEICENGGTIIVADVDGNLLAKHREHYREAGSFFKAYARYEEGSRLPIYASDETSFWNTQKSIICKPDKMEISDWLRPIYKDLTGVLVSFAVPLAACESILASGNKGTTGAKHLEEWVAPEDPCSFASVARRGRGFAAFIAGTVSSDVFLEKCPHNTIWLSRIAEFLVAEAERIGRAGHLFRFPL
jgi:hypothetical protein